MEYDDPGQIPVIYLMMLFNIPVIYLYMPYFAIVNRQILGLGGALEHFPLADVQSLLGPLSDCTLIVWQ